MEDKCEVDNKGDDVMLPGFRFHPTDEELVGFYLRKKVQGRVLPIELIKQVDIYKYDPWDLPKFASTGEKEWYFYCPRDRKYRNSTRPNRVTGAGFWKATGTDRPIYSSEGTKCIGLKKSLVFYRGRAAKGLKTDWMMHEFRLPSSVTPDSNPSNKKFLDRNIPPNDLWAICRIFRKTNTMAQQRAMSHQWGLQFLIEPELLGQASHSTSSFSPENLSCTTDIGSATQLGIGTGSINDLQHSNFYSNTGAHLYRSNIPNVCKSSGYTVSNGEIANNFMFSPIDGPTKSSIETSIIIAPTLLADGRKSAESVDLEGPQQFIGWFSNTLATDLQASMGDGGELEDSGARKESAPSHGGCQWTNPIRPALFPFSLPSGMPWDSPPCPSDISTSFPTNKCYT